MQTAPLAEITRMSVAERIQLVEDIWDTIATHPDGLSLPEVQQQELDRRSNAYCQDPQTGAPWQEVRQRISAQK